MRICDYCNEKEAKGWIGPCGEDLLWFELCYECEQTHNENNKSEMKINKENKLSEIAERIVAIAKIRRSYDRETTSLYKRATMIMDKGPNDYFYEWHQETNKRIDEEAAAEHEGDK